MRRCLAVAAIGCLILQVACRRNAHQAAGLLSPDTMRVVIGEMLKADAFNELRALKDTNYRHDTAYAVAYINIFGSHHISKEQFQDSYNFYMSKPEELKAIIDTMTDRTNREMMKRMPGPMVHPPYPNNNNNNNNIHQPTWQNRVPHNGSIGHPANPANFKPGKSGPPKPVPGVVPKVV